MLPIMIKLLHQLRRRLPHDNSDYKKRDLDPCAPEIFSY